MHYAYGAHRPFSQVSPLDRLFDVTVPASGGAYTLDRGKSSFTDDSNPFRVTHGTSYRGLFDLADLDRSTYIQTTGQSGNVFSSNYRDFAQKWADTEAITIPIDDETLRGGFARRVASETQKLDGIRGSGEGDHNRFLVRGAFLQARIPGREVRKVWPFDGHFEPGIGEAAERDIANSELVA